MKKFNALFLAVALFLTGCNQSNPQPTTPTVFESPRVTITGLGNYPLGEFVDVSAKVENSPNLAATDYIWRVFELSTNEAGGIVEVEKKIRAKDNSFMMSTGVEPRRFVVELITTHLFMVRGSNGQVREAGTKTERQVGYVVTGNPAPGPGPNPNPTPPKPNPAPVLPDGKFKLAKVAYDAAMANVPADKRAVASKALSNSFRGIRSAIAAGTLKEPAQILKQTLESNRTAVASVGVDRAVWEPVFRSLQDAVYALYEGKTIDTVDDFKDAWEEIAQGFEQVK